MLQRIVDLLLVALRPHFVEERKLRADCSVGSASVSSSELVCSEFVPPRTAARAWIVTRTILLYGCCAVSEQPAVCVWKRSIHERGSFAPYRSRITFAHTLRAARN